MDLAILCAALIQTAACVLCMALGSEQIEHEKHTEDDGPIEMEHRHGE